MSGGKGKSGDPKVRSGVYGVINVGTSRRKFDKGKKKKKKDVYRKKKVYGRRTDDFGEPFMNRR